MIPLLPDTFNSSCSTGETTGFDDNDFTSSFVHVDEMDLEMSSKSELKEEGTFLMAVNAVFGSCFWK
jgi:hypothetical protein